ncbi:MAG: nicotinate-nucleotide adenylyltransferase [Desulfobacterales bacterium]|nr:nicotinate-nucleotide adenylyltransferase [Desulfobacterales bacterium]
MDAGLFGGTFNPLHNGHLGIISHVKEEYALDKVFLFPSATPPHKSDLNLAPAIDRLHMVEASIRGMAGIEASDIELRRSGPSFTIDTIREFKSQLAPEDRCFLIMGSDAFFDIPTWKKTREIFMAVPIIVMLRGEDVDAAVFSEFIDEHISKGYRWKEEENRFLHARLSPIHICRVPKIAISSTLIRRRIQQGHPISDLVPEAVESLITKKELYT